jgi:hypothetical protein
MLSRLKFGLVLLGLLPTMAKAETADYAEGLPARWYQLPEELDSAAVLDMDSMDLTATAIGAQKKVRALFLSTQDSLDAFSIRKTSPGIESQKWKATGLQLNLGIGMSGMMGALVGKGTISTTVGWTRKRSESRQALASSQPLVHKGRQTFRISSLASPQVVTRTIAAAEQAVLATGKITDPATFHYFLQKRVLSAYQLISSLAGPKLGGWEATQFTLSLAIEASGMVMPGLSVGGGLQLQFVFDIEPSNTPNVAMTPASELERKQKIQLQNLVVALKNEMDQVPEMKVASHKFLADQVNISIGATISGDIGVAEVEGEFSGTLTFEPRAYPPLVLRRDEELSRISTPIFLIKKDRGQSQQDYAQRNGIEELADAGPGLKAYIVPSGHFRRGFKRAMKLSQFVTKAGDHIFSEHWTLATIQPNFTLSIGGDLALVSIFGNASIGINFTKI